MLTDAEILRLRASGKLRAVKTRVQGEREVRVLLLCEPMQTALDAGMSSQHPRQIDRWESLAADFSHFVEGGLVTWNFMKWLEPKKHEIWELRSKRPKPSLRVFGRFAQPNVFIATHVKERKALKGRFSLEFELEKLTAEETWNCLTPTKPFMGDRYEDYISINARRKPKVEDE